MSRERELHNGDAQDFAHKQRLRTDSPRLSPAILLNGKCSYTAVPVKDCTCVFCRLQKEGPDGA